jgi:hypothetical protein
MRRLPFIFLALSYLAVEAICQVPRTLSYQGILCDTSGVARPDNSYIVTFRLYGVESGGTPIWTEQKTLVTSRGLFSTQLGDQVGFGPNVTFSNPYWLSIQVASGAELSPRVPLSAVAYSFKATNADTAAYASVAGSASTGDNFGDHTATRNVQLNRHWLSGDGDNEGVYVSDSGKVGINTSSPKAALHVGGVDGVLFEGWWGYGSIPQEGSGTRMMWYPRRGAFRAGGAYDHQWDDVNIGGYSTAMGYDVEASGDGSTAIGYRIIASGDNSTALGYGTLAYGAASTALGSFSYALGHHSTAIGQYTEASGPNSTAMGNFVRTNGKLGSFIIGDYCDARDTVSCSHDNEFMAVFSGGYTLYTARTRTLGVYMAANSSGWTNICDRNRKENFCALDGEELLSKIRSLSITEWNYKGGDSNVKYIGPVAQEFFAAFHLGGTDSLGINSISIDGVNMAAVQALEKRTRELREKTVELDAVQRKLAEMETRLARLELILSSKENLTQHISTLTDYRQRTESRP